MSVDSDLAPTARLISYSIKKTTVLVAKDDERDVDKCLVIIKVPMRNVLYST